MPGLPSRHDKANCKSTRNSQLDTKTSTVNNLKHSEPISEHKLISTLNSVKSPGTISHKSKRNEIISNSNNRSSHNVSNKVSSSKHLTQETPKTLSTRKSTSAVTRPLVNKKTTTTVNQTSNLHPSHVNTKLNASRRPLTTTSRPKDNHTSQVSHLKSSLRADVHVTKSTQYASTNQRLLNSPDSLIKDKSLYERGVRANHHIRGRTGVYNVPKTQYV